MPVNRLMDKIAKMPNYEKKAYLTRQQEILDIMQRKRTVSDRARKLLYKKHDEEIFMIASYLYYLVEANDEKLTKK